MTKNGLAVVSAPRVIEADDLTDLQSTSEALTAAVDAVRRAQEDVAAARGAFLFCLSRLRRVYGLADGEDIDLATGRIVATPPPQPPEA